MTTHGPKNTGDNTGDYGTSLAILKELAGAYLREVRSITMGDPYPTFNNSAAGVKRFFSAWEEKIKSSLNKLSMKAGQAPGTLMGTESAADKQKEIKVLLALLVNFTESFIYKISKDPYSIRPHTIMNLNKEYKKHPEYSRFADYVERGDKLIREYLLNTLDANTSESPQKLIEAISKDPELQKDYQIEGSGLEEYCGNIAEGLFIDIARGEDYTKSLSAAIKIRACAWYARQFAWPNHGADISVKVDVPDHILGTIPEYRTERGELKGTEKAEIQQIIKTLVTCLQGKSEEEEEEIKKVLNARIAYYDRSECHHQGDKPKTKNLLELFIKAKEMDIKEAQEFLKTHNLSSEDVQTSRIPGPRRKSCNDKDKSSLDGAPPSPRRRRNTI